MPPGRTCDLGSREATTTAVGLPAATSSEIYQMATEPLVTVLTPVYNGEPFLAECIESVLKQTYRNYEYIIVNNCSKDKTLEIASEYANKDSRIRIYNNARFVGVIENHNCAFRRISPESKYCKVVSGDDWLFQECIARLVQVAEANPSVGLVGSYQLSGFGKNRKDWHVKWTELPYPSTVSSGRELCRTYLLEGPPYAFGTPTSLLYRSSVVRTDENFYPNGLVGRGAVLDDIVPEQGGEVVVAGSEGARPGAGGGRAARRGHARCLPARRPGGRGPPGGGSGRHRAPGPVSELRSAVRRVSSLHSAPADQAARFAIAASWTAPGSTFQDSRCSPLTMTSNPVAGRA